MHTIAIYDNPIDFPGMVVARIFDPQGRPTHEYYAGEDLAGARHWAQEKILDKGRIPICFPRNPQDDPVVVEVWL